jgi:hypothetical protein
MASAGASCASRRMSVRDSCSASVSSTALLRSKAFTASRSRPAWARANVAGPQSSAAGRKRSPGRPAQPGQSSAGRRGGARRLRGAQGCDHLCSCCAGGSLLAWGGAGELHTGDGGPHTAPSPTRSSSCGRLMTTTESPRPRHRRGRRQPAGAGIAHLTTRTQPVARTHPSGRCHHSLRS